MPETIDMIKLVEELPKRRRGKACIVLTHDYSGQKPWAQKLAQKTGAKHIDLLDTFLEDEGLSGKLREFLVPNLFDFLEGQAGKDVLIVTGLEFLKATWAAQSNIVHQLAQRIEMRPKNPAFVFVMQYDEEIANLSFTRIHQYRFVIDQKETYTL